MGSLTNAYEALLAERAEQEKVASATNNNEDTATMEVIEKYASLAEQALETEHGQDYTKEDVVKLATLMIEHDFQAQQDLEKVAELEEAGIIMARAFKAELGRQE